MLFWKKITLKNPKKSKIDIKMNKINYYLLLWEFFTTVWASSFSLEFEWQQVSSSLQDSSQYSGQS